MGPKRFSTSGYVAQYVVGLRSQLGYDYFTDLRRTCDPDVVPLRMMSYILPPLARSSPSVVGKYSLIKVLLSLLCVVRVPFQASESQALPCLGGVPWGISSAYCPLTRNGPA